ncbi:response regulator [Phormidium sp. CCY1219]|uniref:response regulator n=1 Tax=Phormidium sp. CCY1219 TaxID=2886104 RepID=UPI002D1F0A40|nr:response regulator [Phormidium sp. CCY1219]MEB3827647.1 response regulator [Phormidium sp. CCY1219]
MNSQNVEILLVEDDLGDIDLIEESFVESQLQVNINVVRDGVEAIAYLNQEPKYANAIRPDLILLDLNLPRKNGQEVLADLKTDPNLKSIPVVIMSNSDAEEDIARSYDLGANCYVKKPIRLKDFITIVRSIESFWFTIVKLPPRI